MFLTLEDIIVNFNSGTLEHPKPGISVRSTAHHGNRQSRLRAISRSGHRKRRRSIGTRHTPDPLGKVPTCHSIKLLHRGDVLRSHLPHLAYWNVGIADNRSSFCWPCAPRRVPPPRNGLTFVIVSMASFDASTIVQSYLMQQYRIRTAADIACAAEPRRSFVHPTCK